MATVLQKFLQKIGDAKCFILSTFDGVELMTGTTVLIQLEFLIILLLCSLTCTVVHRDEASSASSKFDKHTIDSLVISYATSIVHVRIAMFYFIFNILLYFNLCY